MAETTVSESILDSVKKLLGLESDYTAFDTDIILHINSVFMILRQLGVGPEQGFAITDRTSVWGDFVNDSYRLDLIKSYVYLKVRMMFDPPQHSALVESVNNLIAEFEWRLNIQGEEIAAANGG